MTKHHFRWSSDARNRAVLLSCSLAFAATSNVASTQEAKPAAAPPAAAVAPPAAAPARFQSITIPPDFKSDKVVREKKRIKDEVLRGVSAFNERDVSEYYMSYVIPRLTSLDAPELGNESRKEIIEDLNLAEKSPAIMKSFNEWLLRTMDTIAVNNFHPAAGINAISIIGRLNDTKQPSGGGLPKPMAAAAGKLLKAAVGGKNDGIRAAALEGLERHLRLGQTNWNEAQKQTVANELIKTLSEKQPIQRSDRAHAWLRGRSLDLLTLIKHKRQEEVYAYAVDRVADKTTDPLLLEKALRFIGAYQTKEGKPEVAQVATTNTLKYLVKSAKTWQESVLRQVASMGGGYSGESQDMSTVEQGYAGGEGEGDPYGGGKPKEKPKPVNPYATQPADVKLKRREMHQLLETVRVGLDGIPYGPVVTAPASGLAAVIVDGPDKTTLADVLKAIEIMQAALNDGEIKDKVALGSKTTVAFDTLIASAERFQGVSDKPVEASINLAPPPEIPDPTGVFGEPGNGPAPVNPNAAAPVIPEGNGFKE
ncbi:MAG: hypothetical protein NTW52_16040 [Planctomycetota bacterium]|nr:hypothetical protein [Planctomycetota bacterium]